MDLSKLSDSDLDAIAKNDMSKVSEEGLLILSGEAPKDPSILQKGLGVVGTALDYAGGLARTSAAGLANIPYSAITGESLTKSDDILNALKGQAPRTAEYLERAGVPEGAKANLMPEFTIPGTDIKVGEGDTSVRDAAGLVGDIALDPLTYLSLGSSAAAKASLPAKTLLEKGGKKVFKSGLKNVDEKVIEKGAKPVSDLVWEKGGWGSTKSIQKRVGEIEKQVAKDRGVMYQMADEGGVTVNMGEALKDSLEKANKLESNPGLKPLAKTLKEKIQAYMDAGNVPVSTASEWKTSLRDGLPESAFDKFGKVKSPVQKVEKSMATGMKEGIENASDAFAPGLGKNISKVNEEWQTILAAKKPLQQQVKKAKNINAVTSVDMGIAGLSVANPTVGLPMLLAKKGGDLSKTTAFRTGLGRGMQRVGQTNLPDYLLRQSIINQSPWTRMRKDNE